MAVHVLVQKKTFGTVHVGKLPRMMISELRFLARWMSRHPVDSQLLEKIVFIIFHLLHYAYLRMPYTTYWMPTFQILAKGLSLRQMVT